MTAAVVVPAPSARHANLVFAVGIIAAFFLLLFTGADQWFFLDEWDFLADRTAWDLDDMLRPHNEHWSTVPILLYRGAFNLVGLTTYLPYRAMAVASHLLCAVLMRTLLRRLGVGPWLSVAVVTPWILFGSGWQDIVWGFQVAWNAALALSMTQLLLADHDGPAGRRDAFGLAAGMISLMCAGIAMPMAGVVGACLWARCGWRRAALHLGPLVGAYGLWTILYGENTFFDSTLTTRKSSFVWTGLSSAVEAFAWTTVGAVALTVFVIVGVFLRWRDLPRSERLFELAVPVLFALGAVGYLLVVSTGRATFGVSIARSSRYLHVLSFLFLPLLAVATTEILRRARALDGLARGVAVVGTFVLLWMGIPGNLREFSDFTLARDLHSGQEDIVRTMATKVTGEPHLPDDGKPLAVTAPDASIGWMRQSIANGRIERLVVDDDIINALNDRAVKLVQVDVAPDRDACEDLVDPLELELSRGDRISFVDSLGIAVDIESASTGDFTVEYHPSYGEVLEATEDLRVVFTNPVPRTRPKICR